MFVKRTLLAASMAALAAPAALHAQTQTLDGISRVSRTAIEPVYAGNEVKGYVTYTKGDKADKKNDNFLLDFYDQDLNKVTNITLQKPAGKYFLLRNAFNGSAFAMYYYNAKDKTLELETYDTSLKKLGFKAIGELNRADMAATMQSFGAQGNDGDSGGGGMFGSMGLFPVPNYGFVRNSYEGTMKGYNLQMYDDKLTPRWRIAADPKAKFYETISLTQAVDKYILGTALRRDGMMSKKINPYMVAIEAATGKKVFEMPVETSTTEQLSLSSFTFDPVKREFIAVGEFYKLNDKPFVNKSQGFFIKRFSEAGKQVAVTNYGWHNQVAAAMPAEARQSLEDGFVNYTHSIVRGSNGMTYIVAEQYKVVGDGLGIAMTMLGGNSSVSKGKIANMLVFALDPEYKLAQVKFFPKDPSVAYVPPGAGLMGTGFLGMYFRQSGQFDYQFTQKNDANSQFNVVYINYDKEKGEATKKVIGNVAFGDNGQFKVDKIDGTSNATASYLYPAKPGYVMLVDYLKKEKKMGMKLVKINI
ncbi:hypothetical protein MUN81_21390 [Hymenobacter sp. 5317J-9]|uniref:DUF6770 family protein n=1 Tax=Hymenobacter sp. 5317J-9 TaxID=2932250 RepID=UPI001FD7052D|nr:DUF6770 family protein [Hymenobacter sp. 5317J-9]UOQ97769.1 hypothetical protein MUN81_21390 [Hymenobacter sp. 5317J-9]